MERLRKSDDLERGVNPYGWRDILAEELDLSRDEYDLLTNNALTLKQIYGFDPAKTDDQVSDELSNAKGFRAALKSAIRTWFHLSARVSSIRTAT